MTVEVRRQCLVCAWRGECTKKHTIKPTSLRCPDFCRDAALAAEGDEPKPVERHKQIEDVFGSS